MPSRELARVRVRFLALREALRERLANGNAMTNINDK